MRTSPRRQMCICLVFRFQNSQNMSGDLGIIDLSNDSSDGEEPVMSLADKVRLRLGGPSQLLHAGQVEDQLPLEFLEDEEIVTVSTHIDLALVDLPESSDADVPSDSSGRDENQSENNSNHRSTFNSQGTDFTKTASSGGAKVIVLM